jgi:hypothetical protein
MWQEQRPDSSVFCPTDRALNAVQCCLYCQHVSLWAQEHELLERSHFRSVLDFILPEMVIISICCFRWKWDTKSLCKFLFSICITIAWLVSTVPWNREILFCFLPDRPVTVVPPWPSCHFSNIRTEFWEKWLTCVILGHLIDRLVGFVLLLGYDTYGTWLRVNERRIAGHISRSLKVIANSLIITDVNIINAGVFFLEWRNFLEEWCLMGCYAAWLL